MEAWVWQTEGHPTTMLRVSTCPDTVALNAALYTLPMSATVSFLIACALVLVQATSFAAPAPELPSRIPQLRLLSVRGPVGEFRGAAALSGALGSLGASKCGVSTLRGCDQKTDRTVYVCIYIYIYMCVSIYIDICV